VVQSAMQRLVLLVEHRGAQRGTSRVRGGPGQEAAARRKVSGLPRLPAQHIILLVFSGNFIGIVCARTLHYQFYSWSVRFPHLHALNKHSLAALPTMSKSRCWRCW